MPHSPVTEHYSDHVDRVATRWFEALDREGFEGAVVHAGSLRVSFLDDYTYPFRPNPLFQHWLPLADAAESALLVKPGERPLLYYHQPDDFWHLAPADPEAWWADSFEVRTVRETGTWREALNGERLAFLGDSPALAAAAPDAAQHNPAGLVDRLHLARTRKTDYEVACMAAANRVAARAHRAAEEAFRSGASEYGIHLAYLEAAGQRDAELPYNNIIGLDEHGAVLHYQHLDREPGAGRSFLIDAGATCQGYCADITRTHAREEGLFAELIGGMDALQRELAGAVKPGVDYRELHLAAHRAIAGLLRASGVITVSPDDAVDSGLSGVFYPHGLGHFIGLQTHDVAGLVGDDGEPIPRPDGHPFLRLTRTLEPGNVVTVEPGLYFIPSLLQSWRDDGREGIDWGRVDELLPHGGIRVEDDVVVTENGPRNLSREAFVTVAGEE